MDEENVVKFQWSKYVLIFELFFILIALTIIRFNFPIRLSLSNLSAPKQINLLLA